MKKKLPYFLIFLFSALLVSIASAQSKSISGKVIDVIDEQGLAGVNIKVKNGTTATASDADGNFKISVSTDEILIFSYVGYENKEISVKNQDFLTVSLATDARLLGDVVVTGYGLQNKRESSGSVSVIKDEKIKQVPLASFDQILQGQAPGLLVISNSGQPGQSAQVRLRGVSSISGANSPLYILDGVQKMHLQTIFVW